MWGTFGNVPTIFGILPNVVGGQGASSRKVSQHWQVAIMVGKVPNLAKNVGDRGFPLERFLDIGRLP